MTILSVQNVVLARRLARCRRTRSPPLRTQQRAAPGREHRRAARRPAGEHRVRAPAQHPAVPEPGRLRPRPVETALPALVLENDQLAPPSCPASAAGCTPSSTSPPASELLYRNPVLQPANFALRNAWFSGGIEWNVGSTGHCTLSCAPMHAARVDGPDGGADAAAVGVGTDPQPAIPARLLAARRTRSSCTSAYGSATRHDVRRPGVLVVQHRRPAVAGHAASSRPPDQAWHFGYGSRLRPGRRTAVRRRDLTYPLRHRAPPTSSSSCPTSAAAVDRLARRRRATAWCRRRPTRLRGRKLFVWGRGRGRAPLAGVAVTEPGTGGYAEIQAGLARTQMEHLRLPAGTNSLAGGVRPAVGGPAAAHGDWGLPARGSVRVCSPLLDGLPAREQAWLASSTLPRRSSSQSDRDGVRWSSAHRLDGVGRYAVQPRTP